MHVVKRMVSNVWIGGGARLYKAIAGFVAMSGVSIIVATWSIRRDTAPQLSW